MTKNPEIKKALKNSFLYRLLIRYRKLIALKKKKSEEKKILKLWELDGRPVPAPHIYKIALIQQYAARFSSNTLIETGTYLGETIEACKHLFKKLITIELDQTLYKNALNTFANDHHIAVYQGDSGDLLEEILANVTEPCLFWLDGHYSAGITAKGQLNTPIINELKHIFKHSVKDHVILIDDARCFTGEDDYPSIEGLRSIINEYDPAMQFTMADDIIRIHR